MPLNIQAPRAVAALLVAFVHLQVLCVAPGPLLSLLRCHL